MEMPARPERPRTYPSAREVPDHRLDSLCHRIDQAVVRATGGATDELLSELVRAAVDSFVDHDADVERAARRVGPLLDRIGQRQAHRGFTAADLDAAFDVARGALHKSLDSVVGDLVNRDGQVGLREDLTTYLARLHVWARRGLDRTHRLRELSEPERRARMATAAFGRQSSAELVQLAAVSGIDPEALVVPVISLDAPLPAALLDAPGSIRAAEPTGVLVAHTWAPDVLEALVDGPAVTGPAVPLAEVGDAVALTRRAVRLLRERGTSGRPRLVACQDLLGELVAESDALLAELAVRKHLTVLDGMPARRKVDLGEVLLMSLELGRPTNTIARELHVPPQTAHSRMKTVRELFGDALDDPLQRLELVVALRAALPRWRTAL
jgi:hypothetical protein